MIRMLRFVTVACISNYPPLPPYPYQLNEVPKNTYKFTSVRSRGLSTDGQRRRRIHYCRFRMNCPTNVLDPIRIRVLRHILIMPTNLLYNNILNYLVSARDYIKQYTIVIINHEWGTRSRNIYFFLIPIDVRRHSGWYSGTPIHIVDISLSTIFKNILIIITITFKFNICKTNK